MRTFAAGVIPTPHEGSRQNVLTPGRALPKRQPGLRVRNLGLISSGRNTARIFSVISCFRMLWARRPSHAFVISSHGFETTDWLVASLLDSTAMKVGTPTRFQAYTNLDCGPVSTQTYHWHDCFLYVRLHSVACLIRKKHAPYCFLNKLAYARSGAHTLLRTELLAQNSVINVCLVVAGLAARVANGFHLWLWSHVNIVFIVCERQCPSLCRNFHVGLMHHFHFLFVHVCYNHMSVIVCLIRWGLDT